MITNLRKYSDTESESKLEVKVDEEVSKAIKAYEEMLARETSDEVLSYSQNFKLILNPIQISSAFDMMKKPFDDVFMPYYSGIFISRLIQNSYDAGYNNFVINTNNFPFNDIGYGLIGNKNNSLIITINGDTADLLPHAKYCTLTANGNIKSVLNHSEKVFAIINGNISNESLFQSNHSSLIVHGNVSKWVLLDRSKYCTLEVYGRYDCEQLGNLPTFSKIILHDKQSYDVCKKIYGGLWNSIKYFNRVIHKP